MMMLAVASFVSCRNIDFPQEGEDGTGTLELRIGSRTKAGTADDGDIISNLHLWLMDTDSTVVKYVSAVGTGGVSASGELKIDSESTAVAKFTNIDRGDYTMFVVANLPDGTDMTSYSPGNRIDKNFVNFVLSIPDGGSKPSFSDGMPLSVVQDLSIKVGKNQVEAQLVRVCGRIRVTVRNNTVDKRIFMQKVKLGDKNPSKGYLFHKEDHSVPEGTVYGEFDKVDASTSVSDYIDPGESFTYLDQYIFETGIDAEADLTLDFNGALFGTGVESAAVGAVEHDVYKAAGPEFTEFKRDNVEGKQVIIKNSAYNFFVFADGIRVREKFYADVNELLTNADIMPYYIWSFNPSSYYTGSTGPSNTTVTNIGTGKYLNISNTDVSLSETSQTLIVGTQPYGMLMRSGSYNLYSPNADSQMISAKDVSGISDDSKLYWYFTPVTKTSATDMLLTNADGGGEADKYFNKQISGITYIDEYGIAQPLKSICRNQDLNIVVNVHYNPESTGLYFTVAAWRPIENDTTFD